MLDPLFPGLSPLLRSASLSARLLRAPSLFLSPLPSVLRRVPLLAASRLLSLRLPRLVALPLAFVLSLSFRGSPAPLLRFSYFTILPLFGAPVCSLFLSLVSRRSRMLSFRLSRAFLLVSPAALPPLALPGVSPVSLSAPPPLVSSDISPGSFVPSLPRLSRLLSFYLPRLAALPYAFVLRLVPASRFFLSALMGRCAPRVRWHTCHYTTMISHRAQGVFSILFLRLFC